MSLLPYFSHIIKKLVGIIIIIRVKLGFFK